MIGHTHRNYEFYQDDLGNDVRCIQIASPLLAQPNEGSIDWIPTPSETPGLKLLAPQGGYKIGS